MRMSRESPSPPKPEALRPVGGGEHRSAVGGWPIAIIGGVLVLLAYSLRYALIPFVFAAVIGFVLDPVLDWSARHLHRHRWPGAVALTLLIIGLVAIAIWWIGHTAFHQLSALAARLPAIIEAAVNAASGPDGIDLFGIHYTPEQLSGLIINGATNLLGAAQVMLAVKIGIGTAAGLILTLVLIPYFLISGPRLAEGALWLVPPERRRSVTDMLPTLVPMLRRYIVGLVCVVIYTAAVAYIGLGPVFHVPNAGLLAVVVGFLELVPVVGPITSMLLIGLAALQQGTFAAIFLMVYAVALRLSIDNLVGPLALGRAVTVHPVVVIFGFVIGAMLFGIIGLLLAVPTAACIKLILQHYYAEPIAPGGSAEPEPAGFECDDRRRNRPEV
jgi:predicted PurR-regulated permease PerM